MGKRIPGKGNNSSKGRVAGVCMVSWGPRRDHRVGAESGGDERALWLKEQLGTVAEAGAEHMAVL